MSIKKSNIIYILLLLTLIFKFLDFIGLKLFVIGVAPNFFAAMYLPLILMNFELIKKYNNDLLVYSLISFSILIIYEFLQSFISFFTFDFYDLTATFFGTLIVIIFSKFFKIP